MGPCLFAALSFGMRYIPILGDIVKLLHRLTLTTLKVIRFVQSISKIIKESLHFSRLP